MKRRLLWLAVLVLAGASLTDTGYGRDRVGRGSTAPMGTGSWHAGYYDPAWGLPVALVAPPNAETQTHWGWGVGNTRITPLGFQFQRNYPGPLSYDPRTFLPVPPWPSDLDQMGTYYIRGPW